MTDLYLMRAARQWPHKIAVVDGHGRHTYQKLVQQATAVASALIADQKDLNEDRIAFLVPAGLDYPSVQWGIWMAGGIALPMCTSHPVAEWEYVLTDSGASQLVVHPSFQDDIHELANRLGLKIHSTDSIYNSPERQLPEVAPERRAMILYTSGTTNKPKGVVSTHLNIEAQVSSLIEAWEWTPDDYILNFLPLHHTHGIINQTCCALASGATVHFFPRFIPEAVWQELIFGRITLFMAVPTVYNRLIRYWDEQDSERQKQLSDAASKLRLMVSGSAALPVPFLEKWEAMTGQRLLERYGMTEIGMALSNPLHGERMAGYVGKPLPGVQVTLGDDEGNPVDGNGPGQILIKGATVFLEYWQKPEATVSSFKDGWFMTGDIAVVEDGNFRILGRNSVDIIKTGGYKVSALEIEDVLLTHPAIRGCAVVGLEDVDWGEKVAGAIVLEEGQSVHLEELRNWAQDKLARYKLPADLIIVSELPRNVMGKVTKKAIINLFNN